MDEFIDNENWRIIPDDTNLLILVFVELVVKPTEKPIFRYDALQS